VSGIVLVGYLAFACRALVERPCLCPFASRLWISGLVGKVVSFVLCLAFDRLGGGLRWLVGESEEGGKEGRKGSSTVVLLFCKGLLAKIRCLK